MPAWPAPSQCCCCGVLLLLLLLALLLLLLLACGFSECVGGHVGCAAADVVSVLPAVAASPN